MDVILEQDGAEVPPGGNAGPQPGQVAPEENGGAGPAGASADSAGAAPAASAEMPALEVQAGPKRLQLAVRNLDEELHTAADPPDASVRARGERLAATSSVGILLDPEVREVLHDHQPDGSETSSVFNARIDGIGAKITARGIPAGAILQGGRVEGYKKKISSM